MEAIKFVTKVGKHGIIKIPELENYVDQKVNVVVALKSKEKSSRTKGNIESFIEKWAGFFSDIETNDTRYNYLMDKYK
jgi:hypothetical protein